MNAILFISICLLQDLTGSAIEESVPFLTERQIFEFLSQFNEDEDIRFAYGFIKSKAPILVRATVFGLKEDPKYKICKDLNQQLAQAEKQKNIFIKQNTIAKIRKELLKEECEENLSQILQKRQKYIKEIALKFNNDLEEQKSELSRKTDFNSAWNRCISFLEEKEAEKYKIFIVVSDGLDNVNKSALQKLPKDVKLFEIPYDNVPEDGTILENLDGFFGR